MEQKKVYKFTKMQAFGNDFAIFDFRNQPNDKFTRSEVIILTDKNYGIGCDQLIVIRKSSKPDDEKGVNVAIEVYNGDGTEALNCGNGVRCIVGYIARETEKPIIRVQIGDRTMVGKADKSKEYAKVNMGIPNISEDIVEIGNKHRVVKVDNFGNIDTQPDNEYNIQYFQVRTKKEVFMRSIEIGTGETLSCGSGTCAVAAYCIKNGITTSPMKIISRGSDIVDSYAEVAWEGEGKPMLLAGKYSFVFTGEVSI